MAQMSLTIADEALSKKLEPGVCNTRRRYELMKMFHAECEKRGVPHTPDDCFRYTSKLPDKYEQMSIFDLEG